MAPPDRSLRWSLAGTEPQRSLLDDDVDPSRELREVEYLHVRARTIISEVPRASRMPFRYTINAYRGCSHACTYCFARPTHEYLNLNIGEDFDRKIVEHLLAQFQEKEGVSLRGDTMALQRLKDAAEKAKCDLSQLQSTEINLPFIAADAEENALHMSVLLTREKLEELVGELVERTEPIVQRALDDAKLTVKQIDQVLLVGGQTRMPLVQKLVASFFGKTPHKGVNPDEVVAVGAAIQAAMLSEEKEGPLLVDVTPLSLGIATFGGHSAKLIERNTTVPTSRQEIFTTTRDNQTAVKIRVLQGESERADDNDLLGEFVLAGIPPGPKGAPEIEVTFDIDANGIVSVSARDLATGRAQSIQVNPRGTLTPEEIERLAAMYQQSDEVAVKG